MNDVTHIVDTEDATTSNVQVIVDAGDCYSIWVHSPRGRWQPIHQPVHCSENPTKHVKLRVIRQRPHLGH